MTRYFLTLCCTIFTACNTEKATENKKDSVVVLKDTISSAMHHQPKEDVKLNYLDSVKRNILANAQFTTDSLFYAFSLEGKFSAEGNEGKATYFRDKVKKIDIVFYGETGKSLYTYILNDSRVEVSQQRYNYHANLTEVKSEKDMIKGDKVVFSTDLNGKVITGHHKAADLDIFYQLKKAVPFSLK